MSRAHTITTTTIDRWLLPHIAAILAYADQDDAFAITLVTWLDEENWAITPTPTLTPSQHLVPVSTESSDDVIDWLMHELATHPEARIARSAMMTWASNYEAPQDLVIGVEGLALAGFPLGLISKKKQTAQLQIVIDANWQTTQSPVQLAERTHELAQQLIATELRKAGGKIGSLHPDTAEWCMAAANTKLYTAPQADLLTLAEAAESEQLHHLSERGEHGLALLAISPTVKDSFVEDLVAE